MTMKKYIYQKESGEWVYGPTKNSICPSGVYRLVVETSGKLTIRHIYNRDIVYQYADSHSDFLKENDEAYTSLNELISATSDFFSGLIKVNLVNQDIQIGAVELKDADTDTRAKIGVGSSMAEDDYALAVADPNLKASVDAINTKQTDGNQKAQPVDAAGINTSAIYRTFNKTVTRPANQTVYAAGDVIGDVAATLDTISDVAKAAGYGVCITNIRIQTTDTGLSGKTIRVHILNDSDTPITDNAAFAIGDATKRRGYIDIEMGTGNLAKEGQAQGENLIINPVARAVYFILETTEGFTPSADSTTLRVEIGCILSN